MSIKRILSSILIFIAAAALGCAPRNAAWDRLYSELSESPGVMDPSVLAGRTIVIDPGHGGEFRGAVGADSLSEADANLGVALYLWGLLKDAGADAHLTRTTDRDFLDKGQTEAADDLANRMELANSFEPDVFMSIHHNSNIALDRDRNGVEVYYRGTDTDASLELARAVHQHLARNLGISNSDVKPGNYFVLRHSEANASVLCEASYISNPRVEKKLKLSAKQKLEAESLFMGLVAYFSKGVPVIERIDDKDAGGRGRISFRVAEGASVPLDPALFRITIGDLEIVPSWNPTDRSISCTVPEDMPNGRYRVTASARSVAGATAVSRPFVHFVSRPAAHMLALPPKRSSLDRYRASVMLLDRLGGPIADGTAVRVAAMGKSFRASPRSSAGTIRFEIPADLIKNRFILQAPGCIDTLSFDSSRSDSILEVSVIDSLSGRPVGFPQVLLPGGASLSGDSDGDIALPERLYEESLIVTARGYVPALLNPANMESVSESRKILLMPHFGGKLLGARVALDPGPSDPTDTGDSAESVTGADINLELSKRVAAILSAAGARVMLTRNGDEPASDDERIFRINSFGAGLAVGMRFDSQKGLESDLMDIRHYPGSEKGVMVSDLFSGALSDLPPWRSASATESSALFLQQTACPAVELHSAVTEGTGRLLSGEKWQSAASNRIVGAIAAFLAGENVPPRRWTITVRKNGIPLGGAAVSIDGVFTAITGEEGEAVFFSLDPGSHTAVVQAPGEKPSGYMNIYLHGGDSSPVVLDVR